MALIAIGWLVIKQPFGESKEGDFSKVLRNWGNSQSETADEFIDKVSDSIDEFEEKDFSIPGIIRRCLGRD